MKVGDLVSFNVYKPSSSVFLTVCKGIIRKERPCIVPGHRDTGPKIYEIVSTTGEVHMIEARSIRVISSS